MYGVKDIATGERRGVQVAQMSPYTGESLAVTVKLLETFTTLKNQGEFQIEIIWAVAISAGNDTKRVVQVKWAGLHESEMIWELVANIHQDAPRIW